MQRPQGGKICWYVEEQITDQRDWNIGKLVMHDEVKGSRARSCRTKFLNCNSSLVLAVLCILGYLAASLVSTPLIPVAPFPLSCDKQKYF